MLRSDPRIHYKMYKAKKNMVYAALFSFAVLGGLGLSQNAKADTVENTNVTPAVQTMTAQSSAADVNAVNSAPTAQPVSAQPVVNSQDDSVSNAASQTPTTTLNVQPVQPAQKFAVTRPANLYAQNLAQIPAQNEAQNVQGDWTWQSSDAPSTDHAIHREIGTDEVNQRMGANFSFDIDASQIKPNNQITVAKLTQNSNNTGRTTVWLENNDIPVLINNQRIGTLSMRPIYDNSNVDSQNQNEVFKELDYILTISAKDFNGVGAQHITINAPWINTLNVHTPWSFRGVKSSDITFTLTGNGGLNKSYHVIYSWPDNIQLTTADPMYYTASANAGAMLTDSGGVNPFIWINDPVLVHATNEQASEFHKTFGKSGAPDLNTSIQYGLHVYATKHNSVLLPNQTASSSHPSLPLFNAQGQTAEVPGKFQWSTMTDYANSGITIPTKKVADNLSLAQLKTLNFEGIVASQQADGSILMYYNIPLKALQTDTSKFTDKDYQSIADSSYYINYAAKDNNDAINMAKQMVQSWRDSAMQGVTYQILPGIPQWAHVSDPSSHPQVYAELLDPDTGKIINTDHQDGTYSNSMASGQAAVKLHVINAQNGTELNQWRKLTNKA